MTIASEMIKNPEKCRLDAQKSNNTSARTVQSDDNSRVHMLPADSIFPNPHQPRRKFDDDSIIRLADSIRRYGILQPLTVRRMETTDGTNNCFEIIAGERRYRAARLLCLSHVPCIIVKADIRKSAELAIIENIQREDLNFFEQASAMASLIDMYRLTQEEVARRLSVSQSFVANKLRILRLTLPERAKILTYGLTERHARALLRVDSAEQRLRIIEYINANSLNVTTTEAHIDRFLAEQTAPKRRNLPKKLVLKDIRIFYNTIDKAVSIVKQAGIDIVSKRTDDENGALLTIRIPRTTDVSRETSQASDYSEQ